MLLYLRALNTVLGPMSILAYGLNYRTASVELRERVAFPEDAVRDALLQVKRIAGVSEAAIISTCNRTELYCAIAPEAEQQLTDWLAQHRPVSADELHDAAYKHWDQDAARHQIRVASGLDSKYSANRRSWDRLKQHTRQPARREL